MNRVRILSIVAVLLSAVTVSGELIVYEYVPGEKVTLDTETGKYWYWGLLDFANLTYDEQISDIAGLGAYGGIEGGWRMASLAEIEYDVFYNYGHSEVLATFENIPEGFVEGRTSDSVLENTHESLFADISGWGVHGFTDGTGHEYVSAWVITDLGPNTNETPVADAGEDQELAVRDTVYLDGGDSHDPDEDPINFSWAFDSLPANSNSVIANDTAVNPSFSPDVAGTYVVELIVNDGTVDSEPDTVSITVVSAEEVVQDLLEELLAFVDGLPSESFKHRWSLGILKGNIRATQYWMSRERYKIALAYQKLLLRRTNGCSRIGKPDRSDLIVNCEEQAIVHPMVLRNIELLKRLIRQ
jgi:hypothetical protein